MVFLLVTLARANLLANNAHLVTFPGNRICSSLATLAMANILTTHALICTYSGKHKEYIVFYMFAQSYFSGDPCCLNSCYFVDTG